MKRLLAHGQFGRPSRDLLGRSSALPALCSSVLPSYRVSSPVAIALILLLLLLPNSLNLDLFTRHYYSADKHKHDDSLGEIGEKARSTAEEFLRVAKEKTDEVTEGAKETLHETKEAVVGETEDKKEKFKRRVEDGRYHQK
ncbi:hypothetical protein BAE44_0018029 [Dichanthelium oligosanthes]|uniref:Uncharacterized protein n=1 Tax=Dichanthelium oligosanthes TaxID=888268 RepID=A0A1E5V7E4_9POAL|nr:hypothetical protein BAE44_0018029 [Dichanthelium oligosanthes]